MRRLRHSIILVATLIGLTAVACSDRPVEDRESWGLDIFLGGKGDSLLGVAPEVTFDVPQQGWVGGTQLVVYRVALRRNDRFQLEISVLEGDLNPHATLFFGTNSQIHSDSWELSDGVLRKQYQVQTAGTHLIAVRAYKNQGEGTYRLKLSCSGGPCNGEFPLPEPDEVVFISDRAECVRKARECTLVEMLKYNGAVGSVRARSLFETCLGNVALDDGTSCASACDGDPYARKLCDDTIKLVPFYADQSPACIERLNHCISTCYTRGDDSDVDLNAETVWDSSEGMCLHYGLSSSCDHFARRSVECGGTIERDTRTECLELCRATFGAFVDGDVHTVCEESCAGL